ncbi:MAG: hypothetical protein ACJ731_08190 [Vicinamibacterales bacterium]
MTRHEELMRARAVLKRNREQFSKAHEHGLDALKRHDYRAFNDAVAEEASTIATHTNTLRRLRDVIQPTKKIDE